MEKDAKRIEYVDVAKGISILLVALFHSQLSNFISIIVEPMSLFRMPLFFILSGVFFSYHWGFKALLYKKFSALIKPYLIVLLSIFMLKLYIDGYLSWGKLFGIFYGVGSGLTWQTLWFLVHLFVLNLYAFGFVNVAEKLNLSLSSQFIAIGFLMALGVLFLYGLGAYNFTFDSVHFIGLPFSADLVLISGGFFLSGYLLKPWLVSFSIDKALFVSAMIIFLLIAIFSDTNIDLNMRLLNSPLLALLGSVCGIYCVLSISTYLCSFNGVKKVLSHIGQCSLFILIFHYPFDYKFYHYLIKYIGGNDNQLAIAIVSFLACIVIPILIKKLVDRQPLLSMFFYSAYRRS